MLRRLVLTAIRLYQMTRVLRAPACRFYPSCSTYAHGCIEKHGLLRGSLLGVSRLLCCHPFHPGGIDDVPENFAWNYLISVDAHAHRT